MRGDGSLEAVARLRALIPPQQYERVMGQWFCEYDHSDLGEVQWYAAMASVIPTESTVIDLGCYLAAQAWLFADHARYIGVNGHLGFELPEMERFAAPNTTHVVATIQQFIAENAELCARPEVVALCSYVPDDQARALVRATFDNVCCFYPKSATR